MRRKNLLVLVATAIGGFSFPPPQSARTLWKRRANQVQHPGLRDVSTRCGHSVGVDWKTFFVRSRPNKEGFPIHPHRVPAPCRNVAQTRVLHLVCATFPQGAGTLWGWKRKPSDCGRDQNQKVLPSHSTNWGNRKVVEIPEIS